MCGMTIMKRNIFKQGGYFVFMRCVEVGTTVSLDSLKKPVVHGSAEVSCETLLVGERTESIWI